MGDYFGEIAIFWREEGEELLIRKLDRNFIIY